VAALGAAGGLLAPGPAVAAASDGSIVGGPELATRGTVVHLVPGVPALPAARASAFVVADLDTGEILAAKDPHGYFAPASTLKILTADTFIPRLKPFSRVRITYADAAVDGTKVGIVPGVRYRVRDLFTAMLVMSGNDAAHAIATAAGGMHKALQLMNAQAQHLQADDTVAKTPNGLDHAGQHSSAYDLALLARDGLQIPAFSKYVGRVRARFPAPHHKHYMIYTHDDLLLRGYRGAIGVKNGYTVAARASFVGAAVRHGHRIVAAMMHANPLGWTDTAQLLTWGFKADGRVQPVGTLVDPLPAPQATPTPAGPVTGVAATATLPTGHHRHGLGVPTAPLVAAGGIVVVFAGLRVRARRSRRWRYRSRYSLPKF
jgi:D-alanyl-D-alanine carboxypeptidase (penicillin-binding protein 5/6)